MEKKRQKLALALVAGMSWSLLAAPAVQAAALGELEVKEVKIEGNQHWRESMIRRMVPELNRQKVDVAKLSSELELLNDTQVGKLAADFAKDGDGYVLTLKVKEAQPQHVALNVNNSGNEYTGNWRSTLTYTHANLTQRADSLGVAYVTSPAHWSDVKQAALAYRTIIPQFGDSVYFTTSYSDVNLGQIANFGGIGISATGKGHTFGAHYQHNIKYTRAHKQLLDFGVDYKHYNNAQDYNYASRLLLSDGVSFNVKTASMSYVDITQSPRNFFAWSLGYT
ncbi:MAG: ShlB/FhaC/HecB family hemolysin secretion/activation protein, partial [Selenomonadaceae bacterium]|nr:ShlB/FhaC/HecB family hemolysin secretion/activation protein [Selenomonadaceae bacterium]